MVVQCCKRLRLPGLTARVTTGIVVTDADGQVLAQTIEVTDCLFRPTDN